MSHSFQGAGGGTMMSHPAGACPKVGGTRPITAKGRGWGADYVNVPVKYQPYYFGDPRQSHHT